MTNWPDKFLEEMNRSQAGTCRFAGAWDSWVWFFGWVGISFVAIVARPIPSFAPHTENQLLFAEAFRASAMAMLIGGTVFLLSEFATLFGKTAILIGSPLSQAFSLTALQAVLTTTSLGQWWLIRFAIAVGLLILTVINLLSLNKHRGAVWTTSLAVLGGAMVATIAATGHARAVSHGVLAAQAVDWVHLAATTIWVGGLFHLAAMLRLAHRYGPDGLPVVNLLAARFSRLALVCALALIATGIYNTWLSFTFVVGVSLC
jgi:putative copper export protein